MAFDISIRILTLLTVLWAGMTFDMSHLYNFVICLAFAHLILSTYFARTKIAMIFVSPKKSILSAGVLVLSVLLVVTGMPLILIFAPHHVFSEVYAVSEGDTLIRSTPTLNACRIALYSVSYIFATRESPSFRDIPVQLTLIIFFVVFSFYLYSLFRSVPKKLTAADRMKIFVFDNICLLVAIASIYRTIDIIFIAFYHFAFWAVFPFSRLAPKSKKDAAVYLFTHIALIWLVWFISPLGVRPICSWPVFIVAFTFNTFAHILFSTVVSSAHPQWMRRMFGVEIPRMPVVE